MIIGLSAVLHDPFDQQKDAAPWHTLLRRDKSLVIVTGVEQVHGASGRSSGLDAGLP